MKPHMFVFFCQSHQFQKRHYNNRQILKKNTKGGTSPPQEAPDLLLTSIAVSTQNIRVSINMELPGGMNIKVNVERFKKKNKSPHFGVLWKSTIQQVKYHLKHLVHELILTIKEVNYNCLSNRSMFEFSKINFIVR